MSNNKKIIGKLERLNGQILALDPSDKDEIVDIGSLLEELVDEIPKDSPGAEELLTLTLTALQAIYEGAVSDPSEAADAVAEAIATVIAKLDCKAGTDDDSSLEEANQALRGIIGTEDEKPACDTEEDKAPAETTAQPQAPEKPAEKIEMSKTLPEDADLEILAEFIIECVDHISAAEAALLDLESNPEDVELINTIFRAFHTIKGTSGFLGLDRTQRLAHLAENLLDRAREGEIKIQGGYADLSLRSCDALRAIIEGLQGIEPGGELTIPEDFDGLLENLENPDAAGITDSDAIAEMRVGDILVASGQTTRDQVDDAASKQGDRRIGETLVEKKAATAADVGKALRTQKKIRGGAQAVSTIRVGTDRLDSLINMVGELVIAQSMVNQDPDVMSGDRPRLKKNIIHAGKIIRELQDLSMSLRMVPLKGTFQKMARLVRDLARKAGKNVRFVTEGEETEIDRNMVEALNDPLIHMIRNSVDHGIESIEQRAQTDKEPTGTVCLKAYHAAGNVVIELIDDGKGLDREKILAKAVERGLVDSGRELSDSDIFSLIFQPGFSTAEKVTDVSGRGVGMDVVKRGVESIRGRIEVSSQPGEGSTFALHLPLTMAITDGMLLRVGKERFILPTVSIEHSFKPTAGMVSTVTNRGEMVMLRGDLLPLFRLHKLFSIPDAIHDPYEALSIVIESNGRRCALMADELLGQQQVVVKSLGQSVGQIPGVAGAAILGDGRVGLILDASGMLKLAMEGEVSTPAEAA